ncbi:endonuclease/exonuclease/phosphatase family protein [Paenibacillus albiflavus]|uniref:Endonuclease/exonuclease/phosphatase family protein n=1 Tax=Paenibacillus albiflavus TaxID=2545760 RepID=A0A4R4EG52_9BACL|nr:endonuclease/exonuclease/phosphatase family protein [Paenibacillus albiflavus]TCZ78759.1 endonuclease/exonuclease/phosphatase family protein [Paenibacillus albiflavus]
MDLKVMTFNLRVPSVFDGLNSWWFRRKSINDLIRTSNAVIIGIQEGSKQMLNAITNHLPSYKWVGAHQGKFSEYCAVIYNERLVTHIDEGTFWLSQTPTIPGSKSWKSAWVRLCTWVHFKSVHAPHQEFVVYNTHLDNKSQEAREQGLQVIWRHMMSYTKGKDLPIILMGDLNAEPQNKVIQYLRKLRRDKNDKIPFFTDVYSRLKNGSLDAIGSTFHNFKGGSKGETLDYIFVTKPFEVQESIVERSKFDSRYPSDHYPVIAKLKLPLVPRIRSNK